jgi:hypothetical protein
MINYQKVYLIVDQKVGIWQKKPYHMLDMHTNKGAKQTLLTYACKQTKGKKRRVIGAQYLHNHSHW